MKDIVPELLEDILQEFDSEVKKSSVIKELVNLVESGKVNYDIANRYAKEIGDILSGIYKRKLASDILPDGRMYYNIAERIIGQPMEKGYNLVADITESVQTVLNIDAGIGIKAIRPELNHGRIDGIVNRAASEEAFDNIGWILDAPVRCFLQSIVDDFVKENAEFHGKSGLHPKIIRKSTGHCCKWCKEIAGVYEYPDVPTDVYRRHDNCNCTVEYDPGTGKMHQDVWSKKWKSEEDFDKIRERKQIGIDSTAGIIQKRINQGQYNLTLSHQQYLKHVEGTKQYSQYSSALLEKGKGQPARLAVSEDEAQNLINQYAGKGTPRITCGGSVDNKEFAAADHVIGQYCTKGGKWIDTRRFEIHYGKKGSHIVPVKEDYRD